MDVPGSLTGAFKARPNPVGLHRSSSTSSLKPFCVRLASSCSWQKKTSSYPSKAKNPEFQTSRATLRPDLLIRCIRQVIHQQCTKFTQRHSQFSSVTGNATRQLSNRAPSRSKISDDKRDAVHLQIHISSTI